MHLAVIIAEIADRADEFLMGVTDREKARSGIAELIDLDYFELAPAARKIVTEGVMAALEADEFFGIEFVGDPFTDDGSEDHP